jgi:hypothetical protein
MGFDMDLSRKKGSNIISYYTLLIRPIFILVGMLSLIVQSYLDYLPVALFGSIGPRPGPKAWLLAFRGEFHDQGDNVKKEYY